MKRYAAIAAVAAGMAFGAAPAVSHPLPPGWTTLPCVVLDARTMVLDLATGTEILPNAQGHYTLGSSYVARLVEGRLVDAATGAALPTAAGAVVDAAGIPIAMASLWSQVACPPGFGVGTQGPAGATGATGATGAPGATGPAGAPGAVVTAALPNKKAAVLSRKLKKAQAQAKKWKKAWQAARQRPAAVKPAVAG